MLLLVSLQLNLAATARLKRCYAFMGVVLLECLITTHVTMKSL